MIGSHGYCFRTQRVPVSRPRATWNCGLVYLQVIFLGGLTAGLFGCPYVTDLHSVVEQEGWSLIQPTLSSSYIGYGTGSLQRDTEELDHLLHYLQQVLSSPVPPGILRSGWGIDYWPEDA